MSTQTILITGGAGYIGSHANAYLSRLGHSTVVFDSLSTGHEELVQWGTLIQGNLLDKESLRKVFSEHSIDIVLHFAAYSIVGDSVRDPATYYENNVLGTLNLLNVMREFSVDKIVFSSTAATYGMPEYLPIDEQHPLLPINPYGRSKLMIEGLLSDFSAAYGLRYVSLRYFNAAGADDAGTIGEWHDPESHLIPVIMNAAIGQVKSISVFGVDYDTEDGSCVRDYVHVTDLASAHGKAMDYLIAGGESDVFNLSTGQGYSVLEIIEALESITGRVITVVHEDARPGDPPVLAGSLEKATKVLGWVPEHSDLTNILTTAWNWHSSTFGKKKS